MRGKRGRLRRGGRERLDPVELSSLSKRREPVDVGVAGRCEDNADRRDVRRSEAAPAQEHLDECAPRAPVAVGEGMNRLELRVGEGGLDERRERLVCAERREVVAGTA